MEDLRNKIPIIESAGIESITNFLYDELLRKGHLNLWDLRRFSRGYSPRTLEISMARINREIINEGWRIKKLSPGRLNSSGGVVISKSEDDLEEKIEIMNREFFDDVKGFYNPKNVIGWEGKELLIYKLDSASFKYTIYGGGDFYFYVLTDPTTNTVKFACSRNQAGYRYIKFIAGFTGDYIDEQVWRIQSGFTDVTTHTTEANKILVNLNTRVPFEQCYPAGATRTGFPLAREDLLRKAFKAFDQITLSRLAQVAQKSPMLASSVKIVNMQGYRELLGKSTKLTLINLEIASKIVGMEIAISKKKPFLLILSHGNKSYYFEITEHQKDIIEEFGNDLFLKLGYLPPKKLDAIRSSTLNLFRQMKGKGLEFVTGTGIFRKDGVVFPSFETRQNIDNIEQ